MKYLLSCFILIFCFYFTLKGQQVKLIAKGSNPDPSYYDITKINNNEFLAGGEFGVLHSIDSLGRVKIIDIPFECSHILRIKKFRSQVFIATSNGQLITYFPESKTFSQNTFNYLYKRRCFYDMLILEDGTIYLCGGASRIANGRLAYPNGFVLKTSVHSNSAPEMIWENKNSFVWSMYYDVEHDKLLISAFSIPFMKSSILSTSDHGLSWTEEYRIKGLVYDLDKIGDELWYCGSRNILYFKDGMIGQLTNKPERTIVSDVGCIYEMFAYDNKMISCNYRGKFYEFDTKTATFTDLKVRNSYPLYALEFARPGKLLLIGHGTTLYMYNYKLQNKIQISSK
ncbi:MAG: hypothetical protein ISR55_07140 [Bacteroidetes bacterium]|nr:hypothetical protein [Bacteroidota bacterium]